MNDLEMEVVVKLLVNANSFTNTGIEITKDIMDNCSLKTAIAYKDMIENHSRSINLIKDLISVHESEIKTKLLINKIKEK